MTNKTNSVLYIGVTNDIKERVKEHKLKLYPRSFTTKYNCNKLVFIEEFNEGPDATLREAQMKKWKRQWKINLIEGQNPSWMDISMNWNINIYKHRNE